MDDNIKDRLQQEVLALAGKVTQLTAEIKRITAAAAPAAPSEQAEQAEPDEAPFLKHWDSVSHDYGFGIEFSAAYRAARASWFAAAAPAAPLPAQPEQSAPTDGLISVDAFYQDAAEDIAHALAHELEDAELNPNDFVTVNREKLLAIANRVLVKAAAMSAPAPAAPLPELTGPSEPNQPLILDKHGTQRFRENVLVAYLLDNGPFNMNDLAEVECPVEDREQFAQLIGYSLSGFGELSYVTDERYYAAQPSCKSAASPSPAPAPQHLDDIAVDAFAVAMKVKMAGQRAKGYGGWDQIAACTDKSLADKLMEHTKKGDPVDVANFAMMLHQRNQDQIEFAIGTLRGAAIDFAKRVASTWIPESAGVPQAVPQGYKLVPLEATPEMQQAGQDAGKNCAWSYAACYRAMLAAAPAFSQLAALQAAPEGAAS